MILVYFLIALLIIIFILLLLLLLIPVNYNLRLLYNEEIHGIISINLGFIYFNFNSNPLLLRIKLFGINLYSGTPQNKKPKITAEGKKAEHKAEEKKSPNSFNIKPFLSKKFLKSSLNLLVDLFNLIKPIKTKISGCIGLPEPHETALLVAAMAATAPLIAGIEIDLEPVWDDEHIELDMQVIGKFIPVILILKLIKFLFQQEIRAIWVKLIKDRKNKPKVQPSINLRGI